MPLPRQIEYHGKTYSIRGLADIAGMSYATLRSRLNGGWDIEKAVTTPVVENVKRKWPFHGRLMTAAELATIHGHISTPAMCSRLNSGMSPEQAVAEPLTKGGKFIKRTENVSQKPIETPGWIPHNSPADRAKCRRCRYSFRDSSGVACGYADDMHERRGCEPGKNCTRFKPCRKDIVADKHRKWMGVINT